MTPNTKRDLIHAVELAQHYWPNAGGNETPRENIRRAFRMVRSNLNVGDHIQAAIGRLEIDAFRHRNM